MTTQEYVKKNNIPRAKNPHVVIRIDNLMYKNCEPHWHCTKCGDYWPFHCFDKEYLENYDECEAK